MAKPKISDERRRYLDEQERATHDGYVDLANAIIARAYKDYVYILLNVRTGLVDSNDASGYIKELQHFFKSDWYAALTSYPGESLLKKAEIEADAIKACLRRPGDIPFKRLQLAGKTCLALNDFHKLRQARGRTHRLEDLESILAECPFFTKSERFVIFVKKRKEYKFQKDFYENNKEEFKNLAKDFGLTQARCKRYIETANQLSFVKDGLKDCTSSLS